MRIPTAVSVSFHASNVVLPASAVLTTTANGVTYTYTAKDVHRGEIWSRVGRGESLSFELSVDAADASRVRLDVTSFQAGYRGLGTGVRNHRHYSALIRKNEAVAAAAAVAEATTSSCAENWACHTTGANRGPGQATVALLITNVGVCSGTLLNNVRGDGTPYVLTARHCENGDPDGGLPNAARGVTVFWNSVAACGLPLGNYYDSGAVTQSGASTVVEQQDAWLIKLDDRPVADDVYYAGWDATGGTFVGGFTPHYAQGRSRQFMQYHGQAAYAALSASTLGVHFESTVWGTVNSLGSGGGGSSGGGLFDESGHLQGVVIRGTRQGDSDLGACPLNPLPVPSFPSAPVYSTALSGVFSSTADPRSTTGSVTLQSVLDPDNTGTRVVDGKVAPPSVRLDGSLGGPSYTGQTITLKWTSKRVQSCTTSGGESDDGWAGTAVGTSGTRELTSLDGGTVTYAITCTDGTSTVSSQFQVQWTLAPPNIFLRSSDSAAFYGAPFSLIWNANLRPCVASGGAGGDGWSGAVSPKGSLSVVPTSLGDITYSVTCGSGARATTVSSTVHVNPPIASVTADAATLRVGEVVHLTTASKGSPCTLSGGGAGDGWAGNTTYNGTVTVTESAAGTYVYTIACGSGAYVQTAQATVTFVGATTPPHVSLAASALSVPLNSPVQFDWDSNVGPCVLSRSGPFNGSLVAWPRSPLGRVLATEDALGEYTYTVTCGSGVTATQAAVVVTYTGAPFLSVFNGPDAAIAGRPFRVFWQSNLAPCTFSGGGNGDGWAGTASILYGNRSVVETTGGTYTYTITCGQASYARTERVTINVLATAPSVTISADSAQQVWGQPVTISWSSDASPCEAVGGAFGDGWAGPVESSGSKTITEYTRQGGIIFQVNCGTSPLNATGRVEVLFRPLKAPSLSSSASSVALGENVTFTWSAADSSACFGWSPIADHGWTGDHPTSGSYVVRADYTGTFSFNLTCGQSLVATVLITVKDAAPVAETPPTSTNTPQTPPPSSGGESSGSGGGGAFRPLDVVALCLVAMLCWMTRRRFR
jgi:hypothetical protein